VAAVRSERLGVAPEPAVLVSIRSTAWLARRSRVAGRLASRTHSAYSWLWLNDRLSNASAAAGLLASAAASSSGTSATRGTSSVSTVMVISSPSSTIRSSRCALRSPIQPVPP